MRGVFSCVVITLNVDGVVTSRPGVPNTTWLNALMDSPRNCERYRSCSRNFLAIDKLTLR